MNEKIQSTIRPHDESARRKINLSSDAQSQVSAGVDSLTLALDSRAINELETIGVAIIDSNDHAQVIAFNDTQVDIPQELTSINLDHASVGGGA